MSKHDEFEGLNRVQRQRVQQTLDAHRPAKPKLRIKWGNVAAYISVLMLIALLLWILIDYTNTPR